MLPEALPHGRPSLAAVMDCAGLVKTHGVLLSSVDADLATEQLRVHALECAAHTSQEHDPASNKTEGDGK